MTAQPHRPPIVYRVALRLAALGVPAAPRAEWLAEWDAELWYASPPAASPHAQSAVARHRVAAAFCRGAFADARCVRSLHAAAEANAPAEAHAPATSGSAIACAVVLLLITLFAAVLFELLPGVRPSLQPLFHSGGNRTVLIWPEGLAGSAAPAVPLRTLRAWERRSQHLFSAFAFYQPVRKPVHVDARHAPELLIARSSANLFTILGLSVAHRPTPVAGDSQPLLVLTDSAWRTQFGGRTDVFGQYIHVGLQSVRVGGVVSDKAAPAGPPVDAFLLLQDAHAAALADSARVFALGRLAAFSAPALERDSRWHLSVPAAAEGSSEFTCTALSAGEAAPLEIFGFALFLALLSLPAITAVSLGDYTRQPLEVAPRLLRAVAPRRWLFLLFKIAALLPATFFGSLDLAYAVHIRSAETPQYIEFASAFVVILFALQWALRDQRRRCPACLRTLTCPARVGQPSRNFLGWNGTELICSGGHGLLHVPELPTSWFSRPRWLALDPSWRSLFPRAA